MDDRALAKLVKKLTRDDLGPPLRPKTLLKLIQASWVHRPEVAQMLAQQQAQAQAQAQQAGAGSNANANNVMTGDDLARHMLAWEGLPGLFAALNRKPGAVATRALVAFKSLLVVHRSA